MLANLGSHKHSDVNVQSELPYTLVKKAPNGSTICTIAVKIFLEQ